MQFSNLQTINRNSLFVISNLFVKKLITKNSANILKCCMMLVSTFSFLLQCDIVIAQSKTPIDSLYFADAYAKDKQLARLETAYRIYARNAETLTLERQVLFAEVLIKTSSGKPERLAEGFKWYKKAADAGFAKGYYGLMICYTQGYGVVKDSVQGLLMNQKLVELEDKDGLYLMGVRCEQGYSVPMDKKKASEFFSRAANKGHVESAYILGRKELERGSGTGSLYWFNKNAYSHIPSMMAIAEIYDKGLVGVPVNKDEAVYWYTKIQREEPGSFYSIYAAAGKRLAAIGSAEPSANSATVRPLFMSLIGGAVTSYSGLMGEAKSISWDEYNSDEIIELISDSKYYSCTIKLDFKNARIRERTIREPANAELRKLYKERNIIPGTSYTYEAEIVNSVNNIDAVRIFNTWVSLIKTFLPGAEQRTNNDATRPGYAFISGMSNGKKVQVYLGVSGINNDYKVKINFREEK